jgi:hypothetical protein
MMSPNRDPCGRLPSYSMILNSSGRFSRRKPPTISSSRMTSPPNSLPSATTISQFGYPMSNFRSDLTTTGCTSCNFFVSTLWRNATAPWTQTRTSGYSSGRATARYAVWPIVMSSFGIEVRRWIRKRVSRKIVTVNPGDTLGKRAIGFKKFLDGEPSAFKRNE